MMLMLVNTPESIDVHTQFLKFSLMFNAHTQVVIAATQFKSLNKHITKNCVWTITALGTS